MILSAQTIRDLEIISPCLPREQRNGMSAGLSYAGYDATAQLDESILNKDGETKGAHRIIVPGAFVVFPTVETFTMPRDVMGFFHPKSTLGRQGLIPIPGVLEPGWGGQATVALVNHGPERVVINDGDPICQIIFQRVDRQCEPYRSKYHNAKGAQGPR